MLPPMQRHATHDAPGNTQSSSVTHSSAGVHSVPSVLVLPSLDDDPLIESSLDEPSLDEPRSPVDTEPPESSVDDSPELELDVVVDVVASVVASDVDMLDVDAPPVEPSVSVSSVATTVVPHPATSTKQTSNRMIDA
jgi:hypothetical protein